MPDTPSIDPHSEQFMTLLTDALRSGPGSPQWHQAVRTLRTSTENVDEFKLLYAAREHLESGREWRSIAAGQGFTRKLFDGIESQSVAPRGLPTATMIALIAAAVILAIVAGVFVMLFKGGGAEKQAIDQLTTTIFGNRFLSASFPPAVPGGWERFGDVPLFTRNGDLRPATLPSSIDPKGYKAGGIVTAAPIPADQAIEIVVVLHAGKPPEDGIIEVFIANGPIVGDRSAETRELAWIFQNGQAKLVLPSTRVEAQGEKLGNLKDVQVKIQLNRDTAIVETAGKRTYAGPSLLGPDHPRYVGVRFRSRPGDTWERTGVATIALQKP